VNDPVDAHVQAYNDRDLDRFIACYSADCVIEDARDAVVCGVIDHQRFIR
jgi:hypothetical protein